jgi:hypothetical protein
MLESLPVELQLMILGSLPTLDVMAVGGTCRRLNLSAHTVLERRIRETAGRGFGVQICAPAEQVLVVQS